MDIAEMKKELCGDFWKALENVDIKNYNPASSEFMFPVTIGMLWHILNEVEKKHLEDTVPVQHEAMIYEAKNSDVENDDIKDRLCHAKKYLQRYIDTTDMDFKRLAESELAIAKTLVRKEYAKLPDENRKRVLLEYEKMHDDIMRQM